MEQRGQQDCWAWIVFSLPEHSRTSYFEDAVANVGVVQEEVIAFSIFTLT